VGGLAGLGTGGEEARGVVLVCVHSEDERVSVDGLDVGDEDRACRDEAAFTFRRAVWRAKRSLRESISELQDIKTSRLRTTDRHLNTCFAIALIYRR